MEKCQGLLYSVASLLPDTSPDLPDMGEILEQTARNQVLLRAFCFIEAPSKIPLSMVVGHCKQTTKFTQPDSEYLKKATVCRRMNLALAETHLKHSGYAHLQKLPGGLQKKKYLIKSHSVNKVRKGMYLSAKILSSHHPLKYFKENGA